MPLCDLIDGLNAGMHMLAKYRQGSYRHWSSSLTSWTVHGAVCSCVILLCVCFLSLKLMKYSSPHMYIACVVASLSIGFFSPSDI